MEVPKMKKLLALALSLCLLTALSAPAHADVIWEPYDDDFWEEHKGEMVYHNRGYLANGPDGFVTLYESPEADRPVANVENGARLYVDHIWPGDGESWGVFSHRTEEVWESAWVRMDQLALVYDHIAFQEDHGDEFREYDGSGDGLTKAFLYSYPGGVFYNFIDEDKGYMPFAEAFTHLYTDEEGLRWTYVGYYMGRRNAWVCIDDPMNEELGVSAPLTAAQVREGIAPIPAGDAAPEPVAGDTATVSVEPESGGGAFPLWAVPAGLVVLVCAGTALLVGKRRRG